MAEKKDDRRVQRTRQALHQALMALILEKRYDKITVQEIIDRANVGRSTFYAHFLDKEDLLVQGFQLFSEDLSAHIVSSEHAGEEAGHVLHSLIFFRHADLHHELYKAMLNGGGDEVLMETARRHLTEGIEAHLQEMVPAGQRLPVPLPVVTNFLAGAMLSVLVWWLEAERPYSPEKINSMFQQLAAEGVANLLQT